MVFFLVPNFLDSKSTVFDCFISCKRKVTVSIFMTFNMMLVYASNNKSNRGSVTFKTAKQAFGM